VASSPVIPPSVLSKDTIPLLSSSDESGDSSHTDEDEDTESATDTSLDDPENDEEELENAVNQIGEDARIGNKIFNSLRKGSCDKCLKTITSEMPEPQNFLVYASECGYELYPTESFSAAALKICYFVDKVLKEKAFVDNLTFYLTRSVKKEFKLTFGCPDHINVFSSKITLIIVLNRIDSYERSTNKVLKTLKRKTPKLSTVQEIEAKAAAIAESKRATVRKRHLQNYYGGFRDKIKKRK